MTCSLPQATVLITTKNRRDTLRAAIKSVYSQDIALELIVADDGSIDGTSELVRRDFPTAILIRNHTSLGIIKARNQAIDAVRTSILFTLDDDAVFTAPDTVSKVLDCIRHPRVGAVAIPYINYVNGKREGAVNVFPWTNHEDFPCVSSFSGGACAFRVNLFRACGGYSGSGRQHEEVSLCLEILEKGYVIRVANVAPIAHFPTHRDVMQGAILRGAIKNRLTFAWEKVPWPFMPILVCGSVARYIALGARNGALWEILLGVGEGISGMTQVRRRSKSFVIYRLYQRLAHKGPLRYSEIEKSLPTERSAEAMNPPNGEGATASDLS